MLPLAGVTGDAQFSETIEGVLERIVFQNEENAYCVAEVRPGGQKTSVTVAGPLPGVQCGETLKLSGVWTRHPQFGEQFKVERFESKLPASVHGIRKYLGSGLIHGIGKTYAKKIVDHFGAETLKVISEQSGRLREVPGIGKQRAVAIKLAWDEQSAVRSVMVFLQTYGVTASQCVRLVKKYGNEADRIIREDPYRLVAEVDRIGFATADKIAHNLGIPSNSASRIDAGVLHAMDQLTARGHTAASADFLVEEADKLLGVGIGPVRERLRVMVECRQLLAVALPLADNPAETTPGYQPSALAAAERQIADRLQVLGSTASRLPPIKIEAAIEWAAGRSGFAFAEQQCEALRNALAHKVSVLTGGPGTGKTTILRALVEILKAKKVRVLLASPTGRASQRLAEAARSDASTIHRLLKYDPNTHGFVHGQDNPLPLDFLIVDEASMLDTQLAARLFSAVPPAAHMLLVGDADQLPSVGAGNVLGDLLTGPPARVTRLDTIFRQSDRSAIVRTAHSILKGVSDPGRLVEAVSGLDPEPDFQFLVAHSADHCAEHVAALHRVFLPRHFPRLNLIRETQVLTPMHRGAAGVGSLNQLLQELLNPPKAEASAGAGYAPAKQMFFREQTRRPLPAKLDYAGGYFGLGDKVIQTRNNYDKGVFNGDIGFVSGIHPDKSGLSVAYDGGTVEYAKSELSELQLAYALTIHKSQGSEYPVVILPLLKAHFMLLQRNLLYTGITRARRKVIVVGEPDAYAMAVKNLRADPRVTCLGARLRRAAECGA